MILKVIKGLLMAASMVFAAMEVDNFVLASTLITATIFLVGYLVKNVFFPSESETGVWTWRDTASALILAVLAAVSAALPDIVVGGVVDWFYMVRIVIAAVITYFGATFYSSAKSIKAQD